MTTHIDALHLRRTFGRDMWLPPRPFGPDGFDMVARDGAASVIATCAEHDGAEWVHASIARDDEMPTYDDLTLLHAAVWKGRGWAYQLFAPAAAHINIHERALHLWGHLDGSPALPNFGSGGSI